MALNQPISLTNDILNIASFLKRMARVQPHKRAVVYPHTRDRAGRVSYTHLTFQQLDHESDHLARGLESVGIRRGVRSILMVKPSLEFFILTFAIFKTGAIPVVVDPGMGLRRMVNCFKEAQPTAFIGVPAAHVLRVLFPGFFKSVNTWVTVGRRWFWSGTTLKRLRLVQETPYPIAGTKRHDTAAILFTTGSTGPAKGVVYSHGNFAAQIMCIKTQYGISTDEIDLPTFPLFALFDPALGMTAVIPDMDPTRPATVNPLKIIEAVNNHGVTNMFASPALLNRVGRYGKKNNVQLPSLKRVISAGAPIMPANIEQFAGILGQGACIHTGYGATEAMPVASMDGGEILAKTRVLSENGLGICVGQPVSEVVVRMIAINDAPIRNWSDAKEIPRGEVGEICVKGPQVTRRYYRRPDADLFAKISDGEDFWHRMGDLGRRDGKGRLWFYGRKSQRVITDNGTLFTIACEAIFNNHPRVYRSALVGVGDAGHQIPVICIELEEGDDGSDKTRLRTELLELAAASEVTRTIKTVLFPDSFPVDIRHNSKIFREKLAKWAEKKCTVQR